MSEEQLAEIEESAPSGEELAPNEAEQNLEEEIQEEAGDEKPEAPADDTQAKPGKGRTSRRIRQLKRKAEEAEARAARVEQKLEEVMKRLGPVEDPRPNRIDFDSEEEYEDALFDWRDNQKAPKQQEEKQEVDPTIQETLDSFEAELEELDEDAAYVVMEEDWPCSKDMTDYIMSSEIRAQLAYHLATHQDIAGKIAKMSPILAARELAKVEGELSSNLKASGSAPETPPPPLEPSKAVSVPIANAEKMSTQQWVEQRRKQLEERYR